MAPPSGAHQDLPRPTGREATLADLLGPRPDGFWRTARWTIALGVVAGGLYLGICAALGLGADDAAIFLPAGLGILLLVPTTVLVAVAWTVRRVRGRGTPDVPSRAVRGWTRAYGFLLGFLVAAVVWAGSSG